LKNTSKVIAKNKNGKKIIICIFNLGLNLIKQSKIVRFYVVIEKITTFSYVDQFFLAVASSLAPE
jgi:hypothetical protein